MKKTLIALAVAGACVASAAQADTSNVTIYGQMNASFDRTRTDSATAGADTNLNAISSNSSRIGFKGTEDMGNGLAANFQIEQQIGIDNNNSTGVFGNAASGNGMRNTYVGLSGKSWGEVRFGNHDTPYKMGTASLDIFADTAGDYNTIIGNVQGTNVRDLRLANVAAYITPAFSGFYAAIATSMMNEIGNGSLTNPSAWSATGVYANGPIFASLSYEKQTTAGTPDSDTKGTKLGLGYTMDAFKVGFVYEHLTNSLADNAGTRNAYGLNGSFTMGNNVLKAAYMKANDGATALDTSAKNWVIGVDHNMSKRTAVYALYTKTTNAAGGTYGVGGLQGANYTPGAGEDPSMWSFGMKHSF